MERQVHHDSNKRS